MVQFIADCWVVGREGRVGFVAIGEELAVGEWCWLFILLGVGHSVEIQGIGVVEGISSCYCGEYEGFTRESIYILSLDTLRIGVSDERLGEYDSAVEVYNCKLVQALN